MSLDVLDDTQIRTGEREHQRVVDTLGLSELTASEIQDILGITGSTNELRLYKDEAQDIVLEKIYTRRNITNAADKERTALMHLASQEVPVRIPTLVTEDKHTDGHGHSVLFTYFEDYAPLSEDRTFLDSLTSGGPTRKLDRVVEAVYQLHIHGVEHKDLHLDNIGSVPSDSEDGFEIMVIDFDLSETADYLEPQQMSDDLVRFTSHMLRFVPYRAAQATLSNIVAAVRSLYSEMIDVDEFENRCAGLLS